MGGVPSRVKTQPASHDQLSSREAKPPARRSLEIADCDPKDLASVSWLFANAARDQSWLNEEAIGAELAATSREALTSVVGDTHDLIVARRGREILGACLTWDDGGGLIWIATIAVAPSVRRQGVARRLIAEVAGRAARAGHHRLWCMTLIENSPADAMLTALGFTRAALLKGHAYKCDCYIWHKDVVTLP